MFRTIDEAVRWITSQRNQEIGFQSFQNYLYENQNHLKQLKIIHVAGTNGKGSTVSMIASCLMEAGYKVGTFTSPHLYVHEDRIRINNQPIPAEDFLRICNKNKGIWESYHLSMFEMDLDVASIWFTEQKTDIVVLEAGLGGRLDSTNVIERSIASVIVSIGLDHMERLGDTVEKIAFEKAGIIKKNGLVICGEKKESCVKVIAEEAKRKNTEFIQTAPAKIYSEFPVEFKYLNMSMQLSSLALYQVSNACVSIETLIQLRNRNLISITDEQLRTGIKKAHWAGRFDIVNISPLTIVDGAHNAHGVAALKESAKRLPRPLRCVFACLKDKDKEEMIQTLSEFTDELILTEFDFYRAMNIDDFSVPEGVVKMHDWKNAVHSAQSHQNGTLLITGSLYFISEVMTYFKENNLIDLTDDDQSFSCQKD